MGIEQVAAQIQKEHQHLSKEIDSLRQEVRETESILNELSSKYHEATKIMDTLEDENNELKA